MKLYDWVYTFYNVCIFKKGPQDVPYSTYALQFLTGSIFIIFCALTNYKLALLNVIIRFVFVRLLLLAYKKPARYVQVMTTFWGVDLTFLFIQLSINSVLLNLGITAPDILLYIEIIWVFAIYTYLIKNSININSSVSFLYVLLLFSIFNVILRGLI